MCGGGKRGCQVTRRSTGPLRCRTGRRTPILMYLPANLMRDAAESPLGATERTSFAHAAYVASAKRA